MEQEITVVVRVSDGNHAKIIQEEIEEVIRNRTTIYHVSEPHSPSKFISELSE